MKSGYTMMNANDMIADMTANNNLGDYYGALVSGYEVNVTYTDNKTMINLELKAGGETEDNPGDKPSGGETEEYTIVVKGDVSGDGEVTAQDLAATQQLIFGDITVSEARFIAVDFSHDGKITAQDLAQELTVLLESL